MTEEQCGAWMRYKQALCARPAGHAGQHRPAEAVGDQLPGEAANGVCGKWMPRAQDRCARAPGHAAEHRTAKALEDHRVRKTQRRARHEIDPGAKARWNRTSRLRGYGLTLEAFDALLKAQGYVCAMGGEPFTEESIICVDHDHACCPGSMKSCGKCVRGLLCSGCNRALGIVERKGEQAQRYLDAVQATRFKRA